MITGASAGIGLAYAEGLAARGCSLVLVARRRQRLESVAQRLASRHGIQAHVIAADLASEDGVKQVLSTLRERGIDIDVLVNNAGFATYGRIDDVDAHADREQVLVNSAAMVGLCHGLIPSMIERGIGLVLNLSSIAAFQPISFMAVYGATKAFNLSYSEALWRETRGTGVRVMAVCPGATATEFFDVVGTLNRITTWLPRFAPRTWVLAIAARQTAPSSSTVVAPREPSPLPAEFGSGLA